MRRAWLVAVARRAVLCGLVIAVVLTVLVGAIGWSRWLGPVIGAAVAAGVTGAIARRAPGVPETARFLDRTLDLKEQLATAVELEGTASSMLATQLQEHARSSVQTVAETWGTRTSAATREWAALALLLCALAVAAVIPLGTAGTAQQRATSAGGGNLQAVPAVPTASAADTRSLAVQVAVVRTQAGNAAPTALGSTAPHAASPATARQQAAQHRTAVTRSRSTPGAGSHTGTSSSGQKSKSNVTASSGHTLPLLKHSENFLPTSPGAKGQKGSFYSSTQPKPGTSGSTGTRSGSGGAASRAPGSPSGAKGTAQRSQSGQQAGSQGAGAGGKQNSSGAKAGNSTQCTLLYTCSRLNASQLTAPGLITGKGQFTGKGLPGGQTAGHSQGAAPKLGATKAATPSSSHQLNITSAYGPTSAGQRAAKQAQGHNGPGSAQQSVVKSGANGAQTFDYVPPDANVVLPGDNGILARYFTAHAAS